MFAGSVSDSSADSRLIEAGIREALGTFGQMLPRESLVLKSQDFIDSSAAACTCLQKLHCDAVTVTISLFGRLSGTLALVLDPKAAQQLVTVLVGAGAATPPFDDMARSALKEAGNIVASAFLVALEPLCGRSGLPGLPDLHIGLPCRDILGIAEGRSFMYALPLTLGAGTNAGRAARGGVFISLHDDGALTSPPF